MVPPGYPQRGKGRSGYVANFVGFVPAQNPRVMVLVMVDHPQQVLSRERLLSTGNTQDLSGRAIDLQISRVRQKLRDDTRASPLIKTVRGEGYVFAAPVAFR